MPILSARLADRGRLAIAVLAAGQSRRFGEKDKLAAPFRGKLLGHHVCDALEGIAASHRWVITSREDHPCSVGWREAGFDIIVNGAAEQGMGSSVALAARQADQAGADALLLCLADMPLVPASHYAALVATLQTSDECDIIASSGGETPMPPACFRSSRFAELMVLQGDSGARHLLQSACVVDCTMELLTDVDDPETLARLAGE